MAKAKSPTVYLVGPSGDWQSAEKVSATDPRLQNTPNLTYYESPDGAYYGVVKGSTAEKNFLQGVSSADPTGMSSGVTHAGDAPKPIVKANADAAKATQDATAAAAVQQQDTTGITGAAGATAPAGTAPAGSDAAASGVNADGTSTTSNPYAAATASGTGVLDTLSSAKQQLEGVDVISGHGTHIEKSRSPDLGAPKPTKTDITSKAADLLNAVYSLSDKDLQNLQTKLQAAGYTTKPGDDLTSTLSAYVSLIADVSSADSNAKPGSQNFHVSVDDYLNRKAAANGVNADGTTNGKSKTETSSSVNLTDPTTAQGLLQKALTDELGRQPTSQEVSDFTSALQSAESSNPTVKSVSGSSDTLLGQTTGDTSSTTSGGIGDLDAFAHNYVQNEHGPEAATDQIGNVYGLAMKALGLSGG